MANGNEELGVFIEDVASSVAPADDDLVLVVRSKQEHQASVAALVEAGVTFDLISSVVGANLVLHVAHGSDANFPRPATTGSVWWQGTVQPNLMQPQDMVVRLDEAV